MDDRLRFEKQIKKLKKQVGEVYGAAQDPYLKRRLGDIYGMMKDLEAEVTFYVEDMNQMYLRNSAFPGDLIGWLDDDFTVDEEDEDEKDDDDTNA
ncbi:MAG: hypothetical protein AAF787_05490 [Chloroflexota bacterium]